MIPTPEKHHAFHLEEVIVFGTIAAAGLFLMFCPDAAVDLIMAIWRI